MKSITIEQMLNRTLVVDPTAEQAADIESGKLVLEHGTEDEATFINTETNEEVVIGLFTVETEYCEHFPERLCVDGEEVD